MAALKLHDLARPSSAGLSAPAGSVVRFQLSADNVLLITPLDQAVSRITRLTIRASSAVTPP